MITAADDIHMMSSCIYGRYLSKELVQIAAVIHTRNQRETGHTRGSSERGHVRGHGERGDMYEDMVRGDMHEDMVREVACTRTW